MTKTIILLLISCLTVTFTYSQIQTEIVIPTFVDKYSEYVKQLEQGHTDINYKEFRESFIESEQFKISSQKLNEYNSLKMDMYVQMGKGDNNGIINVAKKMLSIDYTNMAAHKMLRQAFKIIGDTINASKYKIIQFGLLNSIVKNGDGKTCATAWPVIQISEEYFILEMLGVSLLSQTIDNNGGLCDKMEVKSEKGEKKIYYFETTKVFDGYKKNGLK